MNDSNTDHCSLSRDMADHKAKLTNAFDIDGNITGYQSHLASDLEETFTKITVEGTEEKAMYKDDNKDGQDDIKDGRDGSSECTLCGPTTNNSHTNNTHLDSGSLAHIHLVDETDNNNAGDDSVTSCRHGNDSGWEGATEPCSQLGEDLLQMYDYVSGRDADICLKLTTGETFHAHRSV